MMIENFKIDKKLAFCFVFSRQNALKFICYSDKNFHIAHKAVLTKGVKIS